MTLDPKAVMIRAGQLKGARANHDAHWQDVADLLLPHRSFTTSFLPGGKRRQRIFNTMPVLALEQLAAGLHGMLTSPAIRWFRLSPMPGAPDSRAARIWFEAATDAMYEVFHSGRSGFHTSLHEAYLEIGGFGNTVIFVANRGRRGPRFQALPMQQCHWATNADGVVDTLYRNFPMPAREVQRLWPDTAPEHVRKIAATHPDRTLEVIHAVEPSRSSGGASRSQGLAAGAGRGWDGCYVLAGEYLEHELYREFPFACARWSVQPGDEYGVGPAMNALPDIQMINEMEKLSLRAHAKAVDAAKFLPHDGFLSNPNFNPGAFNYYDRDAWRGLSNPIMTEPPPRVDIGEQKIEQVQERINGIFYVTWLRLPAQPNMTATEVMQRRDEHLRLLSPFVSRLSDELLNPIIERTFAVMMRNFLFPPPPPELRGQGWTVEYMGPLAQAQRAAQAETVMRLLAAGQPLLAADPAVLQENIDAGEAFRFLADRTGAPAGIVRSADQVAALRQQRAEAEAMQAQAMALRQGAGAAKDGAAALATIAGLPQ
jgi:hypothetical protein